MGLVVFLFPGCECACVRAPVGVCPGSQEGQCRAVFLSLINLPDQEELLSVEQHKGSSRGQRDWGEGGGGSLLCFLCHHLF